MNFSGLTFLFRDAPGRGERPASRIARRAIARSTLALAILGFLFTAAASQMPELSPDGAPTVGGTASARPNIPDREPDVAGPNPYNGQDSQDPNPNAGYPDDGSDGGAPRSCDPQYDSNC